MSRRECSPRQAGLWWRRARPSSEDFSRNYHENRRICERCSNPKETVIVNKKRIAMVTGGMGGLGEAICIKLAALGDTVVSTYSPANTRASEWLSAMKAQGYEFHAYPCDVTDWGSCAACVARVTAEIGPVDVLVNNAGITRDMTFKKMDSVNWEAVMHSNLTSVFNMTKQVCDAMIERG